ASGNGKGQIFVRGEVIKTVPEAQIVETLIEEAMRIASEMGSETNTAHPADHGPGTTPSGSPIVTVS
ncbi:MAG TPA: 4-hydroxy-3-methylbut-2-en-1-yl diphosphate synthase, partial [Mycobacterium sp.]